MRLTAITSNAPTWRGIAEPIEIRLWTKEVGADYLTARTGRVTERIAAEALSQRLDGLPLAHEQAAAHQEQSAVLAHQEGLFGYDRHCESQIVILALCSGSR
jgi:hypothetical protein